MLNILFWSLYILVPIFSIVLLKLAGERINQVSLVNVTTVSIYMFSIIGTLPLFYFLDDYRYYIGVRDQYLVLKVLFYSSVNLIFFLFGVVFFRKVLGFQPIKFRSIEINPLNFNQKQVLIGVFAFCVLVLLSYIRQLDQIAIVAAFQDSARMAAQVRSDMGNSFAGNYHWYRLFMRDLGFMLTYSCFALWLNQKKTSTFIAFIIAFSYSVFVAVMAIEKSPLAWFLIGLFMVYYLVRCDGLIPFRKLLAMAILIIGVMVFSYVYFMGSSDLASALGSVFSRAFSGSISPAYFYLEFFPEHQDYVFGRTFPNPGGLMPYEPYRYTTEIYNWVHPSFSLIGGVGSAPTVFWGESYANFGPLAIPIIAFIMGCLLSTYSYIVSKIEINPLTIGFFVWLIISFKNLSISGFSGFLYSTNIFVMTLVAIIVLGARRYMKIRKNIGSSTSDF